jgi:hypothetical protein
MPAKKKSNLSKSKKNRKNKEINDSQSEEQYIKKLEAQRIAKAKYLQKESFENKKERLEKQSIRDKLNNSRILREHDESLRSQVVTRTRGALKRKSENQINPASKKTKKVILFLYFHTTSSCC